MGKADAALVEELLEAARAAIADPELRARLVPDAVDDVDADHLRLRIGLFRQMPSMQRLVLGAHAAKARLGEPVAPTPAREAKIASLQQVARRFCADSSAVDELFAPDTLSRLPEAELDKLHQDLEKMALAQRKDLEILLDMDRRAEEKEARDAARAAGTQDRAADMAARKAKLEAMRAELDAKLAEMKARQRKT
jgi:hypothetical protein